MLEGNNGERPPDWWKQATRVRVEVQLGAQQGTCVADGVMVEGLRELMAPRGGTHSAQSAHHGIEQLRLALGWDQYDIDEVMTSGCTTAMLRRRST
jgi:hypothetical protein